MWTIFKVFIEFVTTLFLFWCFAWELCGILTLRPGIDGPIDGLPNAPIWEMEKEMATHSSTLAWKIPWTEERGRLQSMESQRVGHNWEISLFTIWEMNHLTPISLEHLLILFAFLLDSLSPSPRMWILHPRWTKETHCDKSQFPLHLWLRSESKMWNLREQDSSNSTPTPSPSSDFLLSEKQWLCPEFKISLMSLKS